MYVGGCRLIDLARKLDKADVEPLNKSADYLRKMEQYAYASEIYEKLGDLKALVILHVDARNWEEVSIFVTLCRPLMLFYIKNAKNCITKFI